jgi:NADH-quinone oxidoreductase subunit A
LLASYLPILFMLILAMVFAVVTIALAHVISPKDPTLQKSMPYESGITEIDPMVERFPVRFYIVAMLFVIFDVIVAMLFVIFDVEVILFFPWAVSFRAFPVYALIDMAIFIGLLGLAFLYAWRNGALEWD